MTVTCCVESVSVKHGETGKKNKLQTKKGFALGVFLWFYFTSGSPKNNLGRRKDTNRKHAMTRKDG